MNPARSLGPALLNWTWTDQRLCALASLVRALVYCVLRQASRPAPPAVESAGVRAEAEQL